MKTIFNKFHRFYDSFNQMVGKYSYNVLLQTELYPLFVGADPGKPGNFSDDFWRDLNDIILIKEGLLLSFEKCFYERSHLSSLRQIGGFYWYLENHSLQNPDFAGAYHDFRKNADSIVEKYGFDSGRKANEHFADFSNPHNRADGTKNNVRDLESINKEMLRLHLTIPLAEQDLKTAQSAANKRRK